MTDTVSLLLVGIVIGHPRVSDFDGAALEELDNAFDEAAYLRNWRPWGWREGLCINCCEKLPQDQQTECMRCGWLQGTQ